MFREKGKFDGTSKKFGLSINFAKAHESDDQLSRHNGSFEKCSETLTTDSQTLKTIRETNNPIAYNLKQLKYHESD
jgi:hypothetical protein